MLPVGDIDMLSPLKIGGSTITINATDVPWLHAGTGTHKCEGAIVYRHKTKIVTVPCYERRKKRGICCSHCSELFSFSDKDGNYSIVPTAKKVVKVYAQGPTKALRQQPRFKEMSKKFDAAVSDISNTCADKNITMPDDWPGFNFSTMCQKLLVDSGVVFPTALSRSFTRSTIAEFNLAGLIGTVQEIYLRLALCFDTNTLTGHIDNLAKIAKTVNTAAIHALQHAFPKNQVFQGPIVAADVLLLAFSHAKEFFVQWLDSDSDENPEDGFTWGPAVSFLKAWAGGITPAALPARPPRPDPPRADDALGLPYDFMLSGSTFCSSQDTRADSDSSEPPEDNDPDYEPTPEKKQPARRKVTFSTPEKPPSTADDSPTEEDHAVPSAQSSPPPKATSPPDIRSPAGFWVVLSGPSPQIYESLPDFNEACKKLRKAGEQVTHLYTRDRDVADDALQAKKTAMANKGRQGRASKAIPCFAIKGGQQSGTYSTRLQAEAAARLHGGEIRQFTSKNKARRWLHNNKKRRKGALTLADKQAVDRAETSGDPTILQQLWTTKRTALQAYVRGSVFEMPFTDEWMALQATASHPPSPRATRRATNTRDIEWYVVTRGKTTGVMPEAEAIKAVTGFRSPSMDGPFRTRRDADVCYIRSLAAVGSNPDTARRPDPEPVASASAPASAAAITIPPESQIAAHETAHPDHTTAFAIRSAQAKGVIALTFHEAHAASHGPLPTPFTKGKTIWDNIVAAENWIKSTTTNPPVISRLQQARERAATTTAPPAAAASATATTSSSGTHGAVGGGIVGLLQLNQKGENKLIKHYFVDWTDDAPIKRSPTGMESDEYMLYEMGEPGEVSHTQAISEGASFEEYAAAKTKTFKNWPLMDANDFQRTCRKIIAVCLELDTESSRLSADAISALQDLAISEFTILKRSNRLGEDNIRFQRRVWTMLQYACTFRLVFCGAMGLNAFRHHVRERYENTTKPTRSRQKTLQTRTPKKSPKKWKYAPRCGCWRCPSPSHYAAQCPVRGPNDEVPLDVQKAILARIAASSLSAAEKKEEVKLCKAYWEDGRQPTKP